MKLRLFVSVKKREEKEPDSYESKANIIATARVEASYKHEERKDVVKKCGKKIEMYLNKISVCR